MRDTFGRTIDYLRISVTDRCNLRCVYCMPKEGVVWEARGQILTFEELTRACRIFARQGIRKIKISGGEPLLRKGVCDFIGALKTLDGIEHVTLTTNGLLLGEQLPALRSAGLDAVNISLDTLDPQRFTAITGNAGDTGDVHLEHILHALHNARAGGLAVKINCVPVAGLNDADIIPLAALAHEHAIAVRFIELMPLGRAAAWRGITGTQVLDTLAARFGQPERAPAPPVGNGPAVYYTFPRFRGTIGIIGAISSPFCEHCNRLRLSAAGLLSPCLSGAAHIDIRPLLRTGSANNAADDLALETAFKQAVRAKPAAHTFAPDSHTNHGDKAMWNIGG